MANTTTEGQAAGSPEWACVANTEWKCNPNEPHFHYRCGYSE